MLTLGFVLFVAASPCAAEELILKNGQKIIGTIVGYENDMFRVETEFGFALIRKDSVASVNFAAGGKRQAGQRRGEADIGNPKTQSAPGSLEDAAGLGPAERGSSGAASATSAKAGSSLAPGTSTSLPAPGSRPLNEPLPAHLQEHVEGNTYVSDSFHFAIFKPPGWKIYEGVPRDTGSAIVAMGTEDEQTLLILDRQVWSGTPDLNNDLAEANLRRTYEGYQRLSESSTQLDGQPAIRRVFSGVLDGVEWHGVSVRLARANLVFGIMGLTSAETFEFQQAIFNKIIKSFHFLSPTTEATLPPRAAAAP